MKELIRTIPDYPKPGILFRDLTPLLKNAHGFQKTIKQLAHRYVEQEIDQIVAIESRGFIIGAALAFALGKGFVPVRKPGKLPGKTIGHSYALEYGTDRVEIHADAILPGQRVLLVDDLIATGGTAEAVCKLIYEVGGQIVECCFLINLPALGGRSRLEKQGHAVFSLWDF